MDGYSVWCSDGDIVVIVSVDKNVGVLDSNDDGSIDGKVIGDKFGRSVGNDDGSIDVTIVGLEDGASVRTVTGVLDG